MKRKLLILTMSALAVAQTVNVIPLTPAEIDKRKAIKTRYDIALKEFCGVSGILWSVESSIIAAHVPKVGKTESVSVFSEDGKYLINNPRQGDEYYRAYKATAIYSLCPGFPNY